MMTTGSQRLDCARCSELWNFRFVCMFFHWLHPRSATSKAVVQLWPHTQSGYHRQLSGFSMTASTTIEAINWQVIKLLLITVITVKASLFLAFKFMVWGFFFPLTLVSESWIAGQLHYFCLIWYRLPITPYLSAKLGLKSYFLPFTSHCYEQLIVTELVQLIFEVFLDLKAIPLNLVHNANIHL